MVTTYEGRHHSHIDLWRRREISPLARFNSLLIALVAGVVPHFGLVGGVRGLVGVVWPVGDKRFVAVRIHSDTKLMFSLFLFARLISALLSKIISNRRTDADKCG